MAQKKNSHPALGAPQARQAGGVEYWLTRKKVKNINLRLDRQGRVQVSAPAAVPLERIDRFVQGHAEWLRHKQQQAAQRQQLAQTLPQPDRQQAMELLCQVSQRVYPLFAQVLGGSPPELRVRQMRSRWGVCCPAKKRITLALGLAALPQPLVEYVVLHEYCHFVHPDHQAGFWQLMCRWMPDAKARRKALAQWPCGPAGE